jgi:hypothetical protein
MLIEIESLRRISPWRIDGGLFRDTKVLSMTAVGWLSRYRMTRE